MTPTERTDTIERLAQQWTSKKNKQDLELFYYESQIEFLCGLDERELGKIAEECSIG